MQAVSEAPKKKKPDIKKISDVKYVVPVEKQVLTKAVVGNFAIKNGSGRRYASFVLRDNTGEIDCIMWEKTIKEIEAGDPNLFESLNAVTPENPLVVAVLGTKEEFNNKTSFKIDKIKEYKDSIVNYIKSTEYDENSMFDYIMMHAQSLREPYSTILVDRLTEHKDAFIIAPASRSNHDNFVGGLLEHTNKMLKASMPFREMYPILNSDILTFVIIMHDFELINGYTLFPTINKTAHEDLVGHSISGAYTVGSDLRKHGVDEEAISAIQNALLGHNGEPQFGAAKRAITAEAKLLHYLDAAVSETSKMSQTIKEQKCKKGLLAKDIYYTDYGFASKIE